MRPFFSTCLATVVLLICPTILTGERLPIKIYTSADGLGTSASFNLVSDPRGFIWLCSRDGLVRFDGHRFITYRIGDDAADPAVFSLLPTRSGQYWIDLNRGTDYRFVPRPDSALLAPRGPDGSDGDARVPMEVVPVGDSPMARFEDAEGDLWTADGKGIYLMTEKDGTFSTQLFDLDLPGGGKPLLFANFVPSKQGGFWIGTDRGVVRRFADGRFAHYSIKPSDGIDHVRYFAEDYHGRLWISRPDGVTVLKAASPIGPTASTAAKVIAGSIGHNGVVLLPATENEAVEFHFDSMLAGGDREAGPRLTKPEIFQVLVGRDGKVWMATNRGIVLFDGSRFRNYTTRDGLATDNISSLTEGADGSIWIASYGGLHRLNPNGLTSFDDADGLERARVNNIFEDGKGELIAVSGNFNISRLRDGKFRMSRPFVSPEAQIMWQSSGAFLDSRGDWWVNTNVGLYKYSGVRTVDELDRREPDAVYDETNGLIGGNILRVFEDSSGSLWFSAYQSPERRGMSRLDRRTGQFDNFFSKDGLPEIAVATAFAEDERGTLWFGFVEGGIARYRDGKFAEVKGETVPTGGITNIFEDSRGRIWVSTSREGLNLVEDPGAESPVFRRYTTDDGLASNNVRCVTEDSFGNLYIGTVRGVNRFTPETGRVSYFGTADGLPADFINVAFRDRGGAIWFGTLNGLARLVPRPDVESRSPDVYVSGLSAAGQDFDVSPLGQREVHLHELAAGTGNIKIDFLGINSGGSPSTMYQYRFESGGPTWSLPSSESSITFANLPAGSHRFLVRAVNADGIASEIPAVVNVTILRPVWQRWWFLLLAAVAIASLIYASYRYRLAQLLKLERIRTSIASDLHDDIGSSLSQIAILSEVAKRRSGSVETNEPLGLIAETSREMVDSMSDIVWAINPARDRLTDVVQRMRRFATDVLEAREIDVRFQVSDVLPDIHLDADIRRHIYLVFKEAVNNIAKHSNADVARILIEAGGNELVISVNDDGRGFDAAEVLRGSDTLGGNGIVNIRQRMEKLGGSVKIESSPSNGTSFRILIPLRQPSWVRDLKRLVLRMSGRNGAT